MLNFTAFSSHVTSGVVACSPNDAENDGATYGVVNKAKKKKRGAPRGKKQVQQHMLLHYFSLHSPHPPKCNDPVFV